MTEKQVRKLTRYQLMELLVEQGKEIERLEEKLAQTEAMLNEKESQLSATGTVRDVTARLEEVAARLCGAVGVEEGGAAEAEAGEGTDGTTGQQ